MAGTPMNPDEPRGGGLSRRRFLADAGVTALAFSIVKPDLVRGSQANSKIDLGLIGCGGRGTWIADLFKKHGGYNIVALADYFPDRVEAAGNKLGVPASSRFTGLSAYRRLLEQKLDAVAIESPPFFHPIQAADAVAAGKHVYLAKPAAVDVPGCMTIEQSAKKATASQRCFLIDFQTRATAPFIEAMRRVHGGALGSFVFGEATYHAEDPFLEKVDAVKSGTPEGVLRGWGLSREYLGRHHHRAEHPHARRHELDHGEAADLRLRHWRPQVPQGRHLLGHVQRHLQVRR